MKITVLFPTVEESKYFVNDKVEVRECGVGLIAATFGTYKAIIETKPDLVILGGIAGVYEGVSYNIGDVVLVEEEVVADLGFFYPEGFRHLSDMSLDMSFDVTHTIKCPYIQPEFGLRSAISNSMNAAMAPFVKIDGVDIENMEGGAFFYVCEKLKVPFLQVRSISNVVDLNRSEWDYDTSIKNLAQGIDKVINSVIKL